MNRELRVALVLVLAGSALVLLAAGRPWVDLVVPQGAPLPPRTVVRSGSDLLPALGPLAFLGLAGVAALAATRGSGRLVVGVLLALAGAAAVLVTVRRLAAGAVDALGAGVGAPRAGSLGFTAWPYAALAGGVLLALGGLVVAVRGRRWSALPSRYEAPARRAEQPAGRPEVVAWEALDRGEDPTGGAAAERP